MDLALYAPGLGYYTAGARKIGDSLVGGDFVTAPEISPLFGRALAAQVAQAVAELTGARPEVRPDAGLVTAPASDPAVLPALVRWLDEAGVVADELALRLPSLDKVFLTLTGHRAEEPAGDGERPGDEGRAA